MRNLMKRILTLVPTQERSVHGGCKGGGRPGPPPAIAFMALIPPPQAQEHGCGRGEWLHSDLTNWVEEWGQGRGGPPVREG